MPKQQPTSSFWRKLLPCSLSSLLLSATLLSVTHAQEKPNIIFILTDDQRDNTFSGDEHEFVQTPNIDALVKQSTHFENAFVVEPTCMPSRAAFLTGTYERVNHIGFSSNIEETEPDSISGTHSLTGTNAQWQQTYPVLLQNSGYETAYVGKWHAFFDGGMKSFDYYKGHEGHGPFYFGEEKTPTNEHQTNLALEFLKSRNQDKPFCLSLCFSTPHGSKVKSMHENLVEPASANPLLKDHPIYGGEHGGKYRNLDISYPLQNPLNAYDFIPESVMDQNQGRTFIYDYDYSADSNKEHHFRYYQMITELDVMVGRLMAYLKENNLEKNTIIIYGSDHGVLMGEYGMGGKGLLYNLSAKIPLFIYDPSAEAGTRKELISSIDVTSTILDYAGVKPAKYMEGRSLVPLIRKQKLETPWRESLFLENLYTGRDTPLQEGIVTKDWKYIRFFKAGDPYLDEGIQTVDKEPVFEMLFDLNADPNELNNLAKAEQVQAQLEQMRKECIAEVKRLNALRKEYFTEYIKPRYDKQKK